MTNTKNTKRALLSSVLALFLCFAMLLGTTYAWFTDSVTSSGNIIKSGTLDVEMFWAKGTEDPASADWKDASTTAIFDYDNWEPGYTDAKHIKIANEGTLDLQWQLAIVPNGSISKLAEVIDVYYVSSATTVATRDDVDNAWYVGSLASVINGGIAAGDLTVADKEYTATIVLKMQETAGNEYQNLSIGDSFSVKLFATQLDSEEDSFGKDYDADIVWDGTIPTAKPDSLVVDTTAKVISINDIQAFAYLNTLVNDANFVDNYGSKWQYTIELNTDIDLFNRAWTPIVLKNFVAFEGNGHTISNLRVSTTGDRAGLFGVVSCNDIGVTYVRNLTIDGAVVNGNKNVGVVVGSGTQAAVENVTVNNAIVGGVKYVGGIFGSGNGSVNGCTVKNSTITINQVVIDPEDNSIDSKEAGGLIGYLSNDGKATTVNKVIANNTVENVTITAPSVASGLVAQPNSSNSGGAVIEVKNNTMKNVTITTTKDATAALYVSNNVNGKTLIENNTADGCSLGNAISDADDLSSALTDSANTNIYIVLTGDVDMPISSLGQQTAGSGEYKLGGAETETITIDLNGYRLNVTTTYWSVLGAVNPDAVFTIKNGTMTSSQTSGTWNSYDLAFANCNYVIEDVVFDKAVAFDNAGKSVTMKNVTINETHDYYALWITAEGQTVEIDGLTINSAGRGIKIDEQYVGTPAKVTLNVSDATFNTVKKAAIMVKSVAGADIKLDNVNIENVVDATNAVWVDSDAEAYADLVTVTGGTKSNESKVITSTSALNEALANGETELFLAAGEYDINNGAGKTLTITGLSKKVVIKVVGGAQGEAGGQLDYGLDSSTVTFNNVTISTNNKTYAGYARLTATYNNCVFDNCYCLNNNSTFNNCVFNVSGDQYNIWTWGAPNATFNDCTFNSDGKALLLYGTANTKLTLNDCIFNDNGGLTALKAAIEIGNDYGTSYKLIVNNTTVNGYEVNDKGINTGTTLWGNKDSMGTDKLNVVVDGVDVY